MDSSPEINNTSTNSASAQADKALVASAYRKIVKKQELTNSERSALKRHEKEREETLRWQHYTTIPKKHWNQMSGRQNTVLNEQAERYGLPFGGAVIDLPKFVRALHNFLAANATKLAKDDDPLMAGGDSPALERYREKKADLADLELKERQNQLIPRDQARQVLGRMAMIQRNGGECLGKQFGPAALVLFNEILDDVAQEVDRFFGPVEPPPISSPPEPPPTAIGEAHAEPDDPTAAAE
jgi:hypothetical protein